MSFVSNEDESILSSKIVQNQVSSQKQQLKLPAISAPITKLRIMSRKQNKAPTILPNIVSDDDQNNNFRNTEIINLRKNQKDLINDDFALEVEEKLKLILGNQDKKPSIQELSQNNDEMSDDIDFQQKINQNKEIIKMHRQKNQKTQRTQKSQKLEKIQKKADFLKISDNKNNKSKAKNTKPISNYDKKMKDYNNLLQNKFLQRKKQSLGIISEKVSKPIERVKSKKIVSMRDALDEAKVNFGYKQFKSNDQIDKIDSKQEIKSLSNSNKGLKLPIDRLATRKKNQDSRKTQQASPPRKVTGTYTLFDSIQTFLQNPTSITKHDKFYKQLSKRLQSSDLARLEQQIKQINDKIGFQEIKVEEKAFLITQSPLESPLERTVRDWKRFAVENRKNLNYQESNFQKELQYIGYLQDRNSSSLNKFIDHQKIMVELKLNKKFAKSIGKQKETLSQSNIR